MEANSRNHANDPVQSDCSYFNNFGSRSIKHAINYRHLTLTLYHVWSIFINLLEGLCLWITFVRSWGVKNGPRQLISNYRGMFHYRAPSTMDVISPEITPPPSLCFIKIKCDTVHELTPLPHPRQVANIPLPYEIFSTHWNIFHTRQTWNIFPDEI